MPVPDLQSLFLELASLDEAQRESRLDEIQHENPTLGADLRSLLDGHDGNRAAGLSTHADPNIDDFHERLRTQELIPGDLVGSYEIIEKIGEGGFSIVYLARQNDPVNRRLAIKLIKPGMDTDSVLARFSSEQQALALLNHSGITRVMDFGTTDDGRPWFAMEYVDGIAITDYCNESKASIDQRLSLFVDLCSAVHHAHLRGILHRDLKPSNILITTDPVSGTPVVKVIDFGIAKAMNMELSKGMLETKLGQLIGTPEYMSPEQAVVSPVDIDVRSDVFSLGVVLYEILSGILPVSANSFHGIDINEMQRLIRENPAVHPLTRFDQQDVEKKNRIASTRKLSTSQLRGLLGSELTWIPMKCLRKDAAQRYESIQSLSEDVTRYRQGLALLAGPEKWSYRSIKFVKRNRTGVAAALFFALLLAFVSVFSTTMWLREQAALSEAERNLAVARSTTEAMKSIAVQLEPEHVFDQLRDHFSPEFMDPLLDSGQPLSSERRGAAISSASDYLMETIYQPLIIEIRKLMDNGQYESAIELATDYSRVAWQANIIPASDALLDILEEAGFRSGVMNEGLRLSLIDRRANNFLSQGDVEGAYELRMTEIEMIRASPNQSELKRRLWYLMNNQALTLVSLGRLEEAHSMAIDLKEISIQLDEIGLIAWSSYTLSSILHERGLWQEAYDESLSENPSWHEAARDGSLASLDEYAFEFILHFANSARRSGHPEEALVAYDALCVVFSETHRGALSPLLSQFDLCQIAEELRTELAVESKDSRQNG